MSEVLLAAIHNGELPSAPAQRLIDAFGSEFDFLEVSDQPEISANIDHQVLGDWATRQWELESQWRRYLDQDSILRGIQGKVGERLWRIRLHLDKRTAADAWRSRQIETFVSAKHAVAWRAFLEGSHDLLLVVESDATLLPETQDGVTRILDRIDLTQPVYVNLAGGLDPSDLGLDAFRVSSDDVASTYERAVSNTSCAYLVTRPMVELIVRHIDSAPDDATLGIDWIFNAVFLEASGSPQPVHCMHADPPVVGHGSRTGITESWHPHR